MQEVVPPSFRGAHALSHRAINDFNQLNGARNNPQENAGNGSVKPPLVLRLFNTSVPWKLYEKSVD